MTVYTPSGPVEVSVHASLHAHAVTTVLAIVPTMCWFVPATQVIVHTVSGPVEVLVPTVVNSEYHSNQQLQFTADDLVRLVRQKQQQGEVVGKQQQQQQPPAGEVEVKRGSDDAGDDVFMMAAAAAAAGGHALPPPKRRKC